MERTSRVIGTMCLLRSSDATNVFTRWGHRESPPASKSEHERTVSNPCSKRSKAYPTGKPESPSTLNRMRYRTERKRHTGVGDRSTLWSRENARRFLTPPAVWPIRFMLKFVQPRRVTGNLAGSTEGGARFIGPMLVLCDPSCSAACFLGELARSQICSSN